MRCRPDRRSQNTSKAVAGTAARLIVVPFHSTTGRLGLPVFFMQNVIVWLSSSQDYSKGQALYTQWGHNPALKTLFAQGDKPFTRKKLRESLEALAQGYRRGNKSSEFFSAAPSGLRLRQPVAAVDAALFAVIAARKKDHNNRRELHGQLRLMCGEKANAFFNTDRFVVQSQIETLSRNIDAYYKQERFYEQHGHLPIIAPVIAPLPSAIPADRAALRQQLINVRCYLTPSYRKRLSVEKILTYEATRLTLETALSEFE